ncbi:MAG: zinc ribbon domain-containing protein [Bacteroidales bacterium]|nr:zinc ribbon domain-containing protein [Bacteroidales bacterium]
MNQTKYQCPKCGNTQYEADTIRTTGGAFSKIFDVQNKKFTAVTCTRCKYTELFKGETSTLGNIFDFFTS